MNCCRWIVAACVTINIGCELFATDEVLEVTSAHQRPVNVHMSGTISALAHLENQIISKSSQQNITILWLFDQSDTIGPVLAETRRGLPQFFKKISAATVKRNGRLQMAASAFGNQSSSLTKSLTTSLPTFLTAMRGIQTDQTGKENVFQAIQTVVQNNQVQEEHHDIFLVIVTDEKGDDTEQLEAAIDACRKFNITAYVLGKEAPFGQVYRSQKYYYSDGVAEKIYLSCGPESAVPEIVPWAIWGRENNSSEILSGYGPYALVRLAEQTGGQFLILDEKKREPVSDERLAKYEPQYFSFKEYQSFVNENAARQALVEVAAIDPRRMSPTTLVFSHQSAKVFQNHIAEGLKYGAGFNQRSFQLLRTIRNGQADHGKLQEARWQAGYDLALGQVLAAQARLILYGDMLVDMQQNPQEFTLKESTAWALVSEAKPPAKNSAEQVIAEAKQFLYSVIQQHPNTPWAEIAKHELQHGFGWRWVEIRGK